PRQWLDDGRARRVDGPALLPAGRAGPRAGDPQGDPERPLEDRFRRRGAEGAVLLHRHEGGRPGLGAGQRPADRQRHRDSRHAAPGDDRDGDGDPAMRRTRGFTLIEVMVAVAILCLMMIIAWGSVVQTMNANKHFGAIQDRYREARNALGRMA